MNDEPLPPAHGYPGPADRARPVRLRVGDEVAERARADDARGVRRLLGAARLGEGGADPDPVADRRPARGAAVAAGQRRRSPGVAWAPDRGIARVEVAIDGGLAARPRCRRRSRTRPGSSGCSRWDGDAGRPHDHGPGDRRHRRRPDGRGRRRPRPTAPAATTRSRSRSADAPPRGPRPCPIPASSVESGHARRRYLFDPPDRFVAGTVGEPGNRDVLPPGPRRRPDRLSVVLEKVQVAVLAERLGRAPRRARATRDRGRRRGPAARRARSPSSTSRSTRRSGRHADRRLGHRGRPRARRGARAHVEDEDEEEAEEPDEDDDEDEDGPDLLRVRMTPRAARAFVARALRVVAAGRPPCPLCGQPLDPQGHICPRRNGTAPLLN